MELFDLEDIGNVSLPRNYRGKVSGGQDLKRDQRRKIIA